MSSRRLAVGAIVSAWSLSFIPAHAQQPSVSEGAAKCAALASLDLTRTPDAIIQVLAAKAVERSDSQVGYCEVSGYVAPSVGFVLRLPADRWNGKFIELGCSGSCGTTYTVGCDEPLRRGYACIVSDGGHKSRNADAKWAYNNPQAVMEYFVRASHVTAVAGKLLVEHHYAQAPQKSYFMGCSAGGTQAMTEAQRFPWDFDGIVAGAPALSVSTLGITHVWNNRAITDADGNPILGQAEIDTLHRAVVASCDLNDGVKDGLIGDPRVCHFNPSQLLCATGKTNGCLTGPQTKAVGRLYGGPVTSSGERIVATSVQKGSELTWLGLFSGSVNRPSPMYSFIGEWFRYYFFQPNPGPVWKPEDFDFDRDYKRLGLAEIMEPGNSPDLRRFKARGGKLLSYTGWSDAGGGQVVDYYETAERVTGGRAATQDFYRLFTVPGMNHCGAGEGVTTVDWLTALEAWVEKGQAPDKIIGVHLKSDGPQAASALAGNPFPIAPPLPAQVDFSRPIYPYPTATKYLGRGDPKDVASFGPVEP